MDSEIVVTEPREKSFQNFFGKLNNQLISSIFFD